MELIHETPAPILTEHGIEFFLETGYGGITAHMHIHPAIEFIYIRQGLFHIELEHRHIYAREGDLVLFHSNAIHMLENIGGDIGSYYVLKMSPALLFSMFHKSSSIYIHPFLKSRNEDMCHFPGNTQPARIRALWRSMIEEYEAQDPSFFAMQRLLACEFLLTCSRLLLHTHDTGDEQSAPLNERSIRLISESINYINDNFASLLTAAGCASRAHLSYNHYAKLFRAVTGKTFKEYLTDLRMAWAYNMILSSTTPISEVALSCGYENVSYFIVEFKKKYGCPPGQFRKNGRPT